MEMKITISEDNTEEIARLATEAGKAALETCALIAEAYAIKLCPVDTGRLRGSITHGVDMGELCAFIGTNVEYAAYVEYGTSRMKPQPYFKPAINDHIEEYKQIINSALENA